MSQRLDEEEWWDCLGDVLQICSNVVNAHGAALHGNRGDGSLVYFGLPSTHRNSAVNAVRAGLELVNESERLFANINERLAPYGIDPIRLRVGIHSGRVVIGDFQGERKATGFALALTERLHSCAKPNTLVLSKATRALIDDHFSLDAPVERKLKGVNEPVETYRALSENTEWNVRRSTFVARTQELDQLRQIWSTIGIGAPKVALITGEAGIGKTRLVREFRHSLNKNRRRVTWRCEPDSIDNTLHPIITAVRKSLYDPKLLPGSDLDTKLAAFLPEGLPLHSAIPALKYMLGLAEKGSDDYKHLSAEARREKYLELLVNSILVLSQQKPLLLIVEDIQWIDPTTIECLGRMAARTDTGPMMILLTQRSDELTEDVCTFASNTFHLPKLDETAARTLAKEIPGAKQLTNVSIEQILSRSDGIPLFIEESTLLATDQQQGMDPAVEKQAISEWDSSTPLKLNDLLTQRIERVGIARETASLAAVIGRTFPLDLVKLVSSLEEESVDDHLHTLINTGMVVLRNIEGREYGQFKHALVRDSAYSILLKSKRQKYHEDIAKILEEHIHYKNSVTPDRLATHYFSAENYQRSFELWMTAGLSARRNSAQREALGHFRNAERLLAVLPEQFLQSKKKDVLTLHLASVRCNVALEGYSSEEAYRHAKQAEEKALQFGSEFELINARFGLVTWLFVRGNVKKANQLANDCLQRTDEALSKVTKDINPNIKETMELGAARASWACGNIEFHRGNFDKAMPLIDRCIEVCRTVSKAGKSMDQDPLIMCLCYQAWYEFDSGDSDRALITMNEAIALANENGRAFTIAFSLGFRAAIHLFRSEYQEAREFADNSITISEKSQYATWHAWALVLKGSALSKEPTTREQGIKDILKGIKLWDDSCAIITKPFMLAQLSEAYFLSGKYELALEKINEALLMIDKYGDRYYEASAKIIQAKIHCSLSNRKHHRSTANDLFKQSIKIANQRKQHSTVLCAISSLYEYLPEERERTANRKILQGALSKMKSGYTTSNYKNAAALFLH